MGTATSADHPPPKTTPTSSAHFGHLPTAMPANFTPVDSASQEIAPSSSETTLESSQAPLPLQSVSESTLGAWRSVSQPTSRHGTPRNWDFSASESGSRPSSGRKRWRDGFSEVWFHWGDKFSSMVLISCGFVQVPYGLMLAAVAARTKRVAETAQKTAEFIQWGERVVHWRSIQPFFHPTFCLFFVNSFVSCSTLMSSVEEAGLATSSTMNLPDRLGHTLSLKPPNFGLPHWTFVHKVVPRRKKWALWIFSLASSGFHRDIQELDKHREVP